MNKSDILDNFTYDEFSNILKTLLIDRTTSTYKSTNNIIWANNNYLKKYGFRYSENNQIFFELVTGSNENLIMPRVLKNKELQKSRTKSNAEVFTPTWIVKKQNDEIDKLYKEDDLEIYTKRKWLEITCGEAPYMATRYDMITGDSIKITDRVGFIDRKIRRINEEIDDKAEWQRLVELAFKSSYGFEWNGDSLLLARKNLLLTYIEFYIYKWNNIPSYGLLMQIAVIISYNLFQMDGLKYIIPLSEKKEKVTSIQLTLSLFEDADKNVIKEKWHITPGKRVKIMNWETNKMEFFDKDIKKNNYRR